MKQVVITGAAGFIGGCLARKLNKQGQTNLVLVDDFTSSAKIQKVAAINYSKTIDRSGFSEWLSENSGNVEFVFHLGARTDTTEFNFRVLDSLNLSYSKLVWEICAVKQIPLLYASSAATYGLGESGFSDNHSLIKELKPLNPYGLSKQLFDMYVLDQHITPPFWCGLKFFNVYGAGEEHKGRMASVVWHAYKQIKSTGKVKLFASHHHDFKDGEQLRDFIAVDDVAEVCIWFYKNYASQKASEVLKPINGIYNLGTGKARTFNDLVHAIFNSLLLSPEIEYIPTPSDIRDKYQYYTQAEMTKLRNAGYTNDFIEMEQGVDTYVQNLGFGNPL